MSNDIGTSIEKLNALAAKMASVIEKASSGDGSLLTTTVWGAAAVVVAAIIAAVIARALKISEFRQAWINGLRDDLSQYISKAHEWMDLYIDFNEERSQERKAEMLPHLERLKYDSFHVLRRVEMRFKPNDEKANALIGKLLALLDPAAFGVSAVHAASSWRSLADEAVAQARTLLKEEWEVTKNPFRKLLRVNAVETKRPHERADAAELSEEQKMKRRSSLIKLFAGTGLSASLLFFCAAVLSAPFTKLVLFMNEPQNTHTPTEWAIFGVTSLIFATIWAGLWLWFKGCEKRFLEIYLKKSPQQDAPAVAPIVAPQS